MKYRLASAYIREQDLSGGLRLIEEIAAVNPDYKDVREQHSRYRELANNRLLQIYTMAPSSEFVGLCRRIASVSIRGAQVKPVDVAIRKNEWVDILADVVTPRWEDQVLFRFIRSPGAVGELVLREMYSRTRDLRAGRGLCLTAGSFTESARSFVEARLIDLVDGSGLMKIFNKLEASQSR
jgi:hypothetical protein